MAEAKQNHPYHMVEPSPWPLITSLSAFVWVVGIVLWAREVTLTVDELTLPAGLITLCSGTAMLFASAFGWWRDVVKESLSSVHTNEVRKGFHYGMVLFILSEVSFFAAFFWGYFYSGLFPTEAIGGTWPPQGMETFEPGDLPFLNTIILLLSGTTITWAHELLLKNDTKGAVRLSWITVALGFLFTAMQALEYAHSPFGIGDNVYASIFFIATGFHGLHVIIGTLFILVNTFRLKSGHFSAKDHFGFEAAAWYWHFVDVVWLFLFVSVYWWGSSH